MEKFRINNHGESRESFNSVQFNRDLRVLHSAEIDVKGTRQRVNILTKCNFINQITNCLSINNYSNQNGNYDKCFLNPNIDNDELKKFSGVHNFSNMKKYPFEISKKLDDHLCIILLNIRSIRNKLNELVIFIDELNYKPHIIIITESWLRDNEIKFFNLEGYQTIANCRSSHRGGGIIIFIRDDIKFNVLKNEQFDKSHFIMINLTKLNTKIAGFYRSPSTKSEIFLEILENILDKTDNLICFGDANFDILKNYDFCTQKYLNTIKNNGYNILNYTDPNNYTYREDKNDRVHISILDHIFSDKFQSDDNFIFETRDICFSDHRLLLFEYKLLIEKQTFPKHKTTIDFDKICYELDSFNFTSYNFNEFLYNFTTLVKENTKTKLINNVNIKNKIFIDEDLKLELKKRKQLYQTKTNNPNNEIHKREFNKQKNKVKLKILEKKTAIFRCKVH